ncbi:MAG TPA: hypothetical protein PKD64_18605 [Pirellulaceae bacterium]|nr:hypothetical protein [Pirellulaceae bacterium]HMO94202.1 hypothetical protein [Pirellulaceae bacterium]HMP71419.1 hypothetical protein [Pirellulaceae bacterium]
MKKWPNFTATVIALVLFSGCIDQKIVDEVGEFRRTIQRIHHTVHTVTSKETLLDLIKQIEWSGHAVLDRNVMLLVEGLPAEIGAETRESLDYAVEYLKAYTKAVLARLDELEPDFLMAKGNRSETARLVMEALHSEVEMPSFIKSLTPSQISLPSDETKIAIKLFGVGLDRLEESEVKFSECTFDAESVSLPGAVTGTGSKHRSGIVIARPSVNAAFVEVAFQQQKIRIPVIARETDPVAPPEPQTFAFRESSLENNGGVKASAKVDICGQNKHFRVEANASNFNLFDNIHLVIEVSQLNASGEVTSVTNKVMPKLPAAKFIPHEPTRRSVVHEGVISSNARFLRLKIYREDHPHQSLTFVDMSIN